MIQLHLVRHVLYEILDQTTKADLWLRLEALYMTKSLANKIRLRERLHIFSIAKGTLIQNHIDEFNFIIIDQESLDVKIEDENKAILLVILLPAFYKHFKEILLYSNNDTSSFADVKANILSQKKV